MNIRLLRCFPIGLVFACFGATILPAQTAGMQFEAVSIHPTVFPGDAFAAGFRAAVSSNPCSGGKLEISGSRVSISSAGVCDLIRMAYGVKSYQIVGVPASVGFSGQDKIPGLPMSAAIAEASKQPTYFCDLEARAPGSAAPTGEQLSEMLRVLLAERFQVTVHREQREMAYYALVAAASGPKLKPAAEGCKPRRDITVTSACDQTMEQLAKRINGLADRVVIDMTGISGKFDYEFPFDRSEGQDFRAFAAAIQENLKLQVEARKGPLEVLVVDHVERPSAN